MGLPPGPEMSQTEQLKAYKEDPIGFLEACAREFGDLFTLDLGMWYCEDQEFNGKWVIIHAPEHLRTMFRENQDRLVAGEATQILFGKKFIPPGGSLGLDGLAHTKRKRFLMPAFRTERLERYAELERDVAERRCREWPRDRPFSLFPELKRITIEVIIETVFGIHEGEIFDYLVTQCMKLENKDTPKEEKNRVVEEVGALMVNKVVKARLEGVSPDRDDIFVQLLQAQNEEGELLSTEDLHDELITLLKAGFGTTSNMLAWAFECILAHQDVYDKVMAELNTVLSDHKLGRSDINKLSYLDGAIKETFRHRPLIPTAGVRLTVAPFPLGGYEIPKGTILANCPHLVHHRADVYPEPEKFKPERFIGVNPNPYEWTPFGGGKRRCVGAGFAQLEMKVVLAVVLSRLRLKLSAPVTKPIYQGFFLSPEGGPLVEIVEVLKD